MFESESESESDNISSDEDFTQKEGNEQILLEILEKENNDENFLDRIEKYDWSNFTSSNLGLMALIEVFGKILNYSTSDKYYKEWVKIEDASDPLDKLILNVIVLYAMNIKLIEDGITKKDCSNLTENNFTSLLFNTYCPLNNETYINDLIKWYEKTEYLDSGLMQWSFLENEYYDKYKLIQIDFDPYIKINNRKKSFMDESDIDFEISLKNIKYFLDNYLEPYFHLKNFIEQISFGEYQELISIINNLHYMVYVEFSQCLSRGVFNSILNDILPKTIELVNRNLKFTIINACAFENIILIDFIKNNFKCEEHKINMIILCYGTRTVIDNYFPVLNKAIIDQMVKLVEEN